MDTVVDALHSTIQRNENLIGVGDWATAIIAELTGCVGHNYFPTYYRLSRLPTLRLCGAFPLTGYCQAIRPVQLERNACDVQIGSGLGWVSVGLSRPHSQTLIAI